MIDFATLQAVCDALPYPVFAKNKDHVLIYGNQPFAAMIGRNDFIGLSDYDMFSKEQSDVFTREDAKVIAGANSTNEEQIGDELVAITHKYPLTLPDGSAGLVGIILTLEHSARGQADAAVSAAQPKLEQLENLLRETVEAKQDALQRALRDPGTGLSNRIGLDRVLDVEIKRAMTTGSRFFLAFADLDYFKRINDRLGHQVGDQVLEKLARRFEALDGVSCVARLGGDEFALVFSLDDRHRSADGIEERAHAARAFLTRPLRVGQKTVPISLSGGIAVFPDHGIDGQTLKQNADAALLTSKRNGRAQFTVFCDDIERAMRRRRLIEDGLPQAIESGAIRPFFQPILCSDTHDVVGAEVLARWSHPALGFIAPDDFISAAQDCGLLAKLDRTIFQTATQLAGPLIRSGQLPQLSFNASPLEVVQPNFADVILDLIKAADLPPSAICIEIVETNAVHDIDSARSNLETLRAAGVCIALDDFGTGFSNLRSLLDLPLDRVKIDRSMIQDLEENKAVFDLFLTIVNLAGILDVALVAEGIETDFSALMVASAGVTHLQGYHFAQPMSLDDLTVWLGEQEAQVA